VTPAGWLGLAGACCFLTGCVVWAATSWRAQVRLEDALEADTRDAMAADDPAPPEWMDQSGYRPPQDQRRCSECGTPAVFCAQLVLSREGLAGCCGACATTGTTHPALVDPRLINLSAERQALNEQRSRQVSD
jgi:hypothetical protein